MATTCVYPTLSNLEAFDYLDEATSGGENYWGLPPDEALAGIRAGTQTCAEFLGVVNAALDEPLPVTPDQFEHWLGAEIQ